VADNLWYLREQKKISVAGLANRAGLPIGLIMEYESGQRSIDPRHLTRLARALYVEDSDIRLQSDPRPGAPPLERQARHESGPDQAQPAASDTLPKPPVSYPAGPPPRGRERPMRSRSEPKPPLPPRPSQLVHLEALLTRLGRSQADVAAAIGKPIASLDRLAVSELLKTIQEEARQITVERHRAYLPEAVDQYEHRYLTAAMTEERPLRFALFDGSVVEGRIVGFGPYNITIRATDDTELTLNKLALVSYARLPNGSAGQEKSQ
jgi:transcriptional regulator with XRE-family HTH domain